VYELKIAYKFTAKTHKTINSPYTLHTVCVIIHGIEKQMRTGVSASGKTIFMQGIFLAFVIFFIGQIVLSPSQKLDVRQVPHPRDGVRAG
jgi:hypothetical protein